MYRGTTPDFVLTIPGVDLTDKTVFVTFEQDYREITKTGDELAVEYGDDTSTISVSLTQQETLGLKKGKADVQVRFIDREGHAEATDKKAVTIDDVLLERVIEYAADST